MPLLGFRAGTAIWRTGLGGSVEGCSKFGLPDRYPYKATPPDFISLGMLVHGLLESRFLGL